VDFDNNLTLGEAWTTLADHVGWAHNSKAQQRYEDEATKAAIDCSARLMKMSKKIPKPRFRWRLWLVPFGGQK
jgi:hypothetical protein